MKISLKLETKISRAINDHFFNILCALDEKDRKNEISHPAWKELFETVLKEQSSMKQEIFEEISSYRGKR